MAKNRIDEMPQFRANLPKHSHVLSHDFGFTATVAHLNPVFHTILNPGEKINLGFDFNLRTMPLEAAAFAKLTVHTEYFFVPMQLLYQPFENIYYNIENQFSTAFVEGDQSTVLPVMNFHSLMDDIYEHRADAVMTVGRAPVESYGQSCTRLFDLLGLNPRGVAAQDSGAGDCYYHPNIFPYQILAYNCIYQYYYRLDNREKFNALSFNIDRYYIEADTAFNWMRQYTVMHYRPLDNDYFTDVKVSPIVDSLNMNSNALQAAQDWLSSNTNISSERGSTDGHVTTFGQQLGDLSGSTGDADFSNDQSTLVHVDTSGASRVGYNLAVSGGDLYGSSTQVNLVSGNSKYSLRSPHTHSLSSVGGSALSTANIRALFATEKLWSITGRAKKNYDDQTLAHFGFKVPHDVKHQISMFGHDVCQIAIGEVISTAATTDAPLGEIAGKGYGSQKSRTHSFTAPCHGVVMAIFSVVPQRNYEYGFMKHNMITGKEDFFIPEYDNLGMQPLFNYEMDGELAMAAVEQAAEIEGWQYRYEQWKRRFNRITGAFVNNRGSLQSWIPSYDSKTYQPDEGVPSYQAFLNLPTDINQIMLAQYPNTWSETYESYWPAVYDTDPFVVDGHVNCVLVSTMSDYSLPRLDA